MKNVIVAGSGRSGTTWVQDALAKCNGMRTLFEPLHPVGVPRAAAFAYRYIPENAEDPVLREYMDTVFSGELRSLWVNYRIRPDRFNPLKYSPIAVFHHVKKFIDHMGRYSSGSRLDGQVVKFIRANLMLPWLVRNFRIPTLLVIRHPCAVVASRIKLAGADWDAEVALNRYRQDSVVHELIGEKFGVDIRDTYGTAAALACVWCIENVLPLEWAPESGYGVTSYEMLMQEPKREWVRVCEMLGLEQVPGGSGLAEPSQQAAPDMKNSRFSTRHIEKWKNELESHQIDEIGGMLERFGCGQYSVESVLPVNRVSPVDGEQS